MSVLGDQGRYAETSYEVLEDHEYFSLLGLKLKTGRTHQIRVHLKHIHHPVFGDPDYDGRKSRIGNLPAAVKGLAVSMLKDINRQALHAKEMRFIHPGTKCPVHFSSELPDDFETLLQHLR